MFSNTNFNNLTEYTENIENMNKIENINKYSFKILDWVNEKYNGLLSYPYIRKNKLYNIYANPNAIDFIMDSYKNEPLHIQWRCLSMNKNIKVMEILAINQDKIDWNVLSRNSSAIKILEANTILIINKDNPNSSTNIAGES